MKPRFTLLACISILLAGTANGQTPNGVWLRYTVKGEEFSVALPAEPAMKTSEVFVERLQKNRVERVLAAKAGGVVYAIYAYENPKPGQSLEEFIAEQTTNSGLNLNRERKVTSGKFRGKEYSSRDTRTPATEQFFATESHLYRFAARGANAEDATVARFFSSIMLGKKQDGLEVVDGPGFSAKLDEKVFTGKEVDTRARIMGFFPPGYTDDAKANRVTGVVILSALFSSTGKVTYVKVISGLPYGLTEKAIEAAKKLKFIPATKDGKNVATWVQLEYNFNLY